MVLHYVSSLRAKVFLFFCFAIATHGLAQTQPQLVIDLAPGKLDQTFSYAKNWTAHVVDGSLSFFIANSSELWTSDGTTNGTRIVKRFTFIREIAALGNVCFISAEDGTQGIELWRSDGTTSGTFLLKDINAGSGSSTPIHLTKAGNVIFFSASSGGAEGRELWRSDGTSAGTYLVKDIQSGSGGSNPANFAAVNSNIFFNANDGVTGKELWFSDGTTGGTTLVKDLVPGAAGSDPYDLVAFNGEVLFSAATPAGSRELWKSDGTTSGTITLSSINPAGNARVAKLIAGDGAVFFQASHPSYGLELWRSNGTSEGTFLLKDITPGPGSQVAYGTSHVDNFAIVGGKLFFTAVATGETPNIWVSDGTVAGTVQLTTTPRSVNWAIPHFHDINGEAYFVGHENGNIAWYKIDDEGNITFVRRNLTNNPFDEASFISMGGYHYFFIGEYYWKSDGTTEGTDRIKTLGFAAGSTPYQMAGANGSLYFATTTPSGLWKTDGTEATTTFATNITYIDKMGSAGDLLFGSGRLGGSSNYTVWRTDGTPEGTFNLATSISNVTAFAALGDIMYFTADFPLGDEIWRSDGTVAGTWSVTSSQSPKPSLIQYLTAVGSRIFYTATSSTYGTELWTSDGTAAGTQLVKDIKPGNGSSNISNVIAFNNKVYFHADDGVNGLELWESDGTAAGTKLVADVRGQDQNIIDLGDLVTSDDNLFFTGYDGDGKPAVWKSNGTAIGTIKLRSFDIWELPRLIGTANGEVTILLYSGTKLELWASSGTTAKRLSTMTDQYFDEYSVDNTVESPSGNAVYFITGHNASDTKFLWRTDGTIAGTSRVNFEGLPQGLSKSETAVYVTGISQKYGWELFVIHETVSMASLAAEVVAEVSSDETLAAYPSPFAKSLSLSVAGNADETYSLRVVSSQGNETQTLGDLKCGRAYQLGDTWKPGLYVLQIRKSNRTFTKKVIKAE